MYIIKVIHFMFLTNFSKQVFFTHFGSICHHLGFSAHPQEFQLIIQVNIPSEQFIPSANLGAVATVMGTVYIWGYISTIRVPLITIRANHPSYRVTTTTIWDII